METELERRREREQGAGGGMERVPLYWFPAEGGPTKGGLSIGSLVAAFPSLSPVFPFPLFRSFTGSAAIRPALARDGQRGTRRKSNDQAERRKRKETKERDGKRNNCAYSSWLRLPPSLSLSHFPSHSFLQPCPFSLRSHHVHSFFSVLSTLYTRVPNVDDFVVVNTAAVMQHGTRWSANVMGPRSAGSGDYPMVESAVSVLAIEWWE